MNSIHPEVFVSDHLTRKELTQDNVALKVGESFNFFNTHRKQTLRYAGGIIAVAVIVWLGFYYTSYKQGVRQQALADAIQLQSAPVGAAPPNGGPSFPTETAKKDAVTKAYIKLSTEYGGSTEGYIAEYSLASLNAESGKFADARRMFQDVADHANANYASLAKLGLAQLDFAENKTSEAQTILKDLIEHPTDLVSKTQATFTLAKGLAPTQPAEARKLLLPLASAGNDSSQAAVTALQELPPQ
jgi:predicted negative regulator of RcsB-dependent stress response